LLVLLNKSENLHRYCCQKPVISTNIGGISEVILHKKKGSIFKINGYNSIIDKLLELINNEKALKALGVQSRN